MAREKPGQTLDATGLVHEAYLRLVGDQQFANRRHFFAAAAEAMRRILIDQARAKQAAKHGGGRQRLDLERQSPAVPGPDDELLALDEALQQLAQEHPDAAEAVRLRYFAGLTIEETAPTLAISVRTANRHWAYAKAWLLDRLRSREKN